MKSMQHDAVVQKRNVKMGLYALTADPQKPMQLPVALASPLD